jgi:hypothetical protein
MDYAPQFDFLHKEGYSIRCIDPAWVESRAAALGGEDGIQKALTEAFDQLAVRIGQNRDEERDPVVYPPDNPGDPYVLLTPILNINGKKQKTEAPVQARPFNPENRKPTIREDFEDLLFEIKPGLNKEALARNVNGEYEDKEIQTRWEGFFMYHHLLTQTTMATFKDTYNATLGRYVIGKVGKNGVALFNRAPYRHTSMRLAVTEAKRLQAEKGEAYGIFRCLDIFGVPTEIYER